MEHETLMLWVAKIDTGASEKYEPMINNRIRYASGK